MEAVMAFEYWYRGSNDSTLASAAARTRSSRSSSKGTLSSTGDGTRRASSSESSASSYSEPMGLRLRLAGPSPPAAMPTVLSGSALRAWCPAPACSSASKRASAATDIRRCSLECTMCGTQAKAIHTIKVGAKSSVFEHADSDISTTAKKSGRKVSIVIMMYSRSSDECRYFTPTTITCSRWASRMPPKTMAYRGTGGHTMWTTPAAHPGHGTSIATAGPLLRSVNW
mmetsp:Transcript_15234/g.39162  ORF Transcript_15234/g.39162 Transcript_15234/m.39162 type:complete len:227 (+) Transcript_15234:549-1229(+)